MNTTKKTNPHAEQPTSIISLLECIWYQRELISQMTVREVIGRYKGSVIGIAWSFFTPILMLTVYTFVFSVVLKAKWGVGNESRTLFALILFSGMIIHGFLSEVFNKAPSLILNNVNYVKKVIFPLQILPIVSMFAALFHSLISLIVLLVAFFVINGYLNWTIIFIPLVVLPFIIFVIGSAWILAALGVYLRDVNQIIGMTTTVMLFLSPVFYPITSVPDRFIPFIMINPLTFIVVQFRKVIIWGQTPDWIGLVIYSFIAILVLMIGYTFFQKTRKGFADVL